MLEHYGKHLEQEKTFEAAKKAISEVFKEDVSEVPAPKSEFKMVG